MAVLLGGCARPAAPAAPPPQVPPPPRTVVSLTFDDGNRTQYLARAPLLDRRMNATFYINSGSVDRADGSTMSWDEIRELAADGNDVGGHTLTHADLAQLGDGARRREICGDRDRLRAEGLNPVSFAFPYGSFENMPTDMLRECGYRSARNAGGISPSGPHYAERIPPPDPYLVAALNNPPGGPLTLEFLQGAVRAAAAHGGGWVPIVLHDVCRPSEPDFAACMRSETPIEIGVLEEFVDWLDGRAPAGTEVLPVSAVIGPR